MFGLLPPSSRVTGMRFWLAYCMISRPVVVSPVKATLATRLLGRLEDDAVARGQRGRQLPDRHQDGEVPRDDLGDHTHVSGWCSRPVPRSPARRPAAAALRRRTGPECV